MRRWQWTVMALALAAPAARAGVETRPVEYRHGPVVLEGSLAYDSAGGGKRAGLLLAAEGAANGPAARQRAEQWARQGYVVFALDLYGKGVAPRDDQDAAVRAGLTAPTAVPCGRGPRPGWRLCAASRRWTRNGWRRSATGPAAPPYWSWPAPAPTWRASSASTAT